MTSYLVSTAAGHFGIETKLRWPGRESVLSLVAPVPELPSIFSWLSFQLSD